MNHWTIPSRLPHLRSICCEVNKGNLKKNIYKYNFAPDTFYFNISLYLSIENIKQVKYLAHAVVFLTFIDTQQFVKLFFSSAGYLSSLFLVSGVIYPSSFILNTTHNLISFLLFTIFKWVVLLFSNFVVMFIIKLSFILTLFVLLSEDCGFQMSENKYLFLNRTIKKINIWPSSLVFLTFKA